MCSRWAKKGYCSNSPYSAYVMKSCCKSCKEKLVKCGVAPLRNDASVLFKRIVKGSAAGLGHYPWQVAIYRKQDDYGEDVTTFHCGGTLIDRKHVVSAAHCFKGIDKNAIFVVLGEHDRSSEDESDTQKVQVGSLVLHKDFNENTVRNDIAMLTLSTEAKYSKYVQPICLPSRDEELAPGKVCSVTGWGRKHAWGDESQQLQEISVPVVGKSKCQTLMSNRNRKITDKMVCTGYNNGRSYHSTCFGDSGGGLVCENSRGSMTFYGIVSWGNNQCNTLHSYNVFTKVSKYTTWIRDHRN